MNYNVEEFIKRYPELEVCRKDIEDAFSILVECFKNGHKLLVAGNGGSCADAEHIAGELMKGFKKKRKIGSELVQKLSVIDSEVAKDLEEKLQDGLPTIALDNHNSINTAFINDVKDGGDFLFAEQLLNYGQEGDVLLGISTSGNAKNIYAAAVLAKAKGMKIISLTGEDGGQLKGISDVTIKAPAKETFIVQEYHLPIYHCLCLMLENEFYKE